MSLLLDEAPLVIQPSLARAIGLNECIIVQQLHYWIQKSNHLYDGYIWIYNTYEEWRAQFPFWSESTIRRIIKKLEDQKIIVSGNYNKSNIDKTKWYRIDYAVLTALTTPTDETESPSVQNEQSSDENVSPSVQDEQSICSSLTVQPLNLNRPIPEITTESTSEKKEEAGGAPTRLTAFAFYEQNNFGLLNSHIGGKIGVWIDDLGEELVIEAMKQALEHSVLTWAYVESILKNWFNKGIRTIEQAHVLINEFKAKKQRQQRGQPRQTARQEVVPEWMKAPEEQQPSVVDGTFDEEAERAKLMKLLNGG